MPVVLALIIILVVGALLVVVRIFMDNGLVGLRNRVDNAWAQVDVQLKRRYDLIPNLVETVKGYASHERATFEEVTNARTRAQQAGSVPEQAAAENVLTAATGRGFAGTGRPPQPRARRRC